VPEKIKGGKRKGINRQCGKRLGREKGTPSVREFGSVTCASKGRVDCKEKRSLREDAEAGPLGGLGCDGKRQGGGTFS